MVNGQSIIDMWVVKLIGVACIIIGMTGCDYVYRLLDKEGAEEKEIVGEVIPFEKNPVIEDAQKLLKLYGYSPGRPDGVLGRRTRDSVEKFQLDNNLKVTRFIDQQTWGLLKQFQDNQLVKNYEVNIFLVQSLLTKAGFRPGKIDGKMGAKTLAAIKAFQKANDLKVDGRIGYHTLFALSSYFH